jgi:hypothetical protein
MDTFFHMPVIELLFVRAAHNPATELTKTSQIWKWRFLKQIIFLLRARVYLRQEIQEQEPATAHQQRIMCDLLKIYLYIYIVWILQCKGFVEERLFLKLEHANLKQTRNNNNNNNNNNQEPQQHSFIHQ